MVAVVDITDLLQNARGAIPSQQVTEQPRIASCMLRKMVIQPWQNRIRQRRELANVQCRSILVQIKKNFLSRHLCFGSTHSLSMRARPCHIQACNKRKRKNQPHNSFRHSVCSDVPRREQLITPQQVAAKRAFGARYQSNLRKVSSDREEPPYRRPTDAQLFGYLPL